MRGSLYYNQLADYNVDFCLLEYVETNYNATLAGRRKEITVQEGINYYSQASKVAEPNFIECLKNKANLAPNITDCDLIYPFEAPIYYDLNKHNTTELQYL